MSFVAPFSGYSGLSGTSGFSGVSGYSGSSGSGISGFSGTSGFSGSSGGNSTAINQSSHGFAAGDVLYHNGSLYAKARADLASTASTVGIVQSAPTSDAFILVTGGMITGLSGLTAGSDYFLSATTAGLLTTTEPSTLTYVSKPMLIATSTTGGVVVNQRGLVITSASLGLVPSVRAKMSGNLSVPTGTPTALDLAGADAWDTNNMHDHTAGTAAERSKIYANTAGIYLITTVAEWSADSVAGFRLFYIYKNGTSLFAEVLDDANQNQATAQHVSDVVSMEVGDYIQAIGHQNSGITLTIAGGADHSGIVTVTWLGRIA